MQSNDGIVFQLVRQKYTQNNQLQYKGLSHYTSNSIDLLVRNGTYSRKENVLYKKKCIEMFAVITNMKNRRCMHPCRLQIVWKRVRLEEIKSTVYCLLLRPFLANISKTTTSNVLLAKKIASLVFSRCNTDRPVVSTSFHKNHNVARHHLMLR